MLQSLIKVSSGAGWVDSISASTVCTHSLTVFQVDYRKARTENFFINLGVTGKRAAASSSSHCSCILIDSPLSPCIPRSTLSSSTAEHFGHLNSRRTTLRRSRWTIQRIHWLTCHLSIARRSVHCRHTGTQNTIDWERKSEIRYVWNDATCPSWWRHLYKLTGHRCTTVYDTSEKSAISSLSLCVPSESVKKFILLRVNFPQVSNVTFNLSASLSLCRVTDTKKSCWSMTCTHTHTRVWEA